MQPTNQNIGQTNNTASNKKFIVIAIIIFLIIAVAVVAFFIWQSKLDQQVKDKQEDNTTSQAEQEQIQPDFQADLIPGQGDPSLSMDKDSDMILGYLEIKLYGTDPNNSDTDGDGYSDGEEVRAGSDPLDPESFIETEEQEQDNTEDNSELMKQDSDSDGLNDFLEQSYGTDPNNPDTDGDGYSDGEEVEAGYDPLGE